MGDTMKKFLALALMVSSLPAWAAPPARFEARVEAVRNAAEVPGMAIAIVENDAVTLARGFGARNARRRR
jgi:CubicO group peptidase (beta-lactamase class C family)